MHPRQSTPENLKFSLLEVSASLNRRPANVVVRLGCEPKTMTETTGRRSPKARLFDQAETKPRPSPPRPPRPARDHNEIRPRPHRDYLRKVTETTETAPYREGVIGLAPRRLARLSTPRRLPFAALTLRFGCRALCSPGRTPASKGNRDTRISIPQAATRPTARTTASDPAEAPEQPPA
jgi:hypothetical protein